LKDWLEKQADNGVFIPPSVILSEMPWMLWVPFPEERSYSPLFACLREEIKSAKAISTPDRGQYLSEAWSIMVDQAIPEYVRFEDWLYELTGSAPDRVGMGKTEERLSSQALHRARDHPGGGLQARPPRGRPGPRGDKR